MGCEAEVVLAWYRRYFFVQSRSRRKHSFFLLAYDTTPRFQCFYMGSDRGLCIVPTGFSRAVSASHCGTNHGCGGGSCAGCEGKADVSVRATFRIHTHIDDTPRRRWEGGSVRDGGSVVDSAVVARRKALVQ